jgi:arylsulfatase A-like enzyme
MKINHRVQSLWKYVGMYLLFGLSFFALETLASSAEQINVPGSPSSTQSVNTTNLPVMPPSFGGEVDLNADQSKSWWPPRVVPPKTAPNVLLIMTDDVGFGAPSTFGGTIPTPTLDRLAKMGLRYNNFHSTALCSPTRSALITGRNHHTMHFGVVSEMATGFPGYDSLIGKDTATVGEILRQNGYATSWFGKEHNVPDWMATQVGPFDHWPTGTGFEYFYGFVGGDTSQWQPNLFRNTTPIHPFLGKPDWNLTTAMADDAEQYLRQLNAIAPNKPFFCYYVPGGTHAPHHAPPEWIAKFKGKFDHGWNVERELIFAKQKELGVIPASAVLTEWPKSLPKWETLSAEEKKLFAHQAEVYAAYLAYTDYEIGRVVKCVEDMGKLDNTLVIYISGDNGASPEGTLSGTPNEIAAFNGVEMPIKEQMKFYDSWGSSATYPHMSVGWAWAFDTPFQWTKEIASHLGGTKQGMVMVWPKRLMDTGSLRSQFHHVIDIAPTILEACGIEQPVMVNGAPQKPIEGVSMVYTWNHAQAESTHRTQYFEMMGNRAIYHDGWMASTTPPAPPWLMGNAVFPKDVVNDYKWELYNLNEDYTQSHNLAASMPDKLKRMQELFLVEAAKYNVLPLDNSFLPRLISARPTPSGAERTVFNYADELANIPNSGAPNILNKSYTITADVDIPSKNAEGMIVTQGGRMGGYGLYVLKGKPVFVYDNLDIERFRWQSESELTPGKHSIVFDFKYDGGGLGKGGVGHLIVDGREVATRQIAHTIPFTLMWDETFDVGVDTGTPIDDKDYQVPFRFTGKLNNLKVELRPAVLSTKDEALLQKKGGASNSASE